MRWQCTAVLEGERNGSQCLVGRALNFIIGMQNILLWHRWVEDLRCDIVTNGKRRLVFSGGISSRWFLENSCCVSVPYLHGVPHGDTETFRTFLAMLGACGRRSTEAFARLFALSIISPRLYLMFLHHSKIHTFHLSSVSSQLPANC